MCNYLRGLQIPSTDERFKAVVAFESALSASAAAVLSEEAVPAEMMQVFSDEQWPELLFEFQPSMYLQSANWNLVDFHAQVLAGHAPALCDFKQGQTYFWLIYRDNEGQLVRTMQQLEYDAMVLMQSGNSFASVAELLWPYENREQQHQRLTEILLVWLEQELVIDAGVPLPADAEFEQEMDAPAS